MRSRPLVIVDTHPIQYHSPVYRAVERVWGVPVHVIYGSDFSLGAYADKEFGVSFAWDTKLVEENDSCTFLERAAQGGASSFEEVSAKGVGAAMERCSPGAVMVTGYQPSFHLHTFHQAWRRKYPILFRAETNDNARSRSALKTWGRRSALRCLYSRCSRLLPIGRRSYQHYRDLGLPDGKLILSPYCVDTTPFEYSESDRVRLRPVAHSEIGAGPDDTVLLFSGKLSARKGPHILIEGLKLLPAEKRNRLLLVFLGDGQERERLEQQAQAEPLVRTKFLGFRNQRQLSAYYHAADAMVLPSVEAETWGLVVNEALHHGVPCIVSDRVGCSLDLVEPGVTGEICEAGSADSLMHAVLRLTPILGRTETRDHCRTKISGYTVEKAAEGIAQAYLSVTARKAA